MNYACMKSEIEMLETMIAKEKERQASICDYICECESHVLKPESTDEIEKFNEARYYADEAERAELEKKLIANKIEYLEKQLALFK